MSAVHPLSGLPVDAIAALAQLHAHDWTALYTIMTSTKPVNGVGCAAVFMANLSAYFEHMNVRNSGNVAKRVTKTALRMMYAGMRLEVKWKGDDRLYDCTLHWCASNGLYVQSEEFDTVGELVLFNPWLDEWYTPPANTRPASATQPSMASVT